MPIRQGQVSCPSPSRHSRQPRGVFPYQIRYRFGQVDIILNAKIPGVLTDLSHLPTRVPGKYSLVKQVFWFSGIKTDENIRI